MSFSAWLVHKHSTTVAIYQRLISELASIDLCRKIASRISWGIPKESTERPWSQWRAMIGNANVPAWVYFNAWLLSILIWSTRIYTKWFSSLFKKWVVAKQETQISTSLCFRWKISALKWLDLRFQRFATCSNTWNEIWTLNLIWQWKPWFRRAPRAMNSWGSSITWQRSSLSNSTIFERFQIGCGKVSFEHDWQCHPAESIASVDCWWS